MSGHQYSGDERTLDSFGNLACALDWRQRQTGRTLTVIAIAILLSHPVECLGQSLAELAAQEEQRRATVVEPSKVYTNTDLPRFTRVSDVERRSAEPLVKC